MKEWTTRRTMVAIPMVLVGVFFGLQSVLWEPTAYGGPLQDGPTAGRKTAKDSKNAVKKTPQNAKKAIGPTRDAVRDMRVPGQDDGDDESYEEDFSQDSGEGDPDTAEGSETEWTEDGYGDEQPHDSMGEEEQAGYGDETGYSDEGFPEDSRPPVDFNEMKGQIPGFTPFGEEDSGSSEGSPIQGDRPWYEKLAIPGGPPPRGGEDE